MSAIMQAVDRGHVLLADIESPVYCPMNDYYDNVDAKEIDEKLRNAKT